MIPAFLPLLLCLPLGAARFESAEPHMGTLFRITLYAPNDTSAQAAFRAAFDRVAQLDNELSDYQPESELNRACRAAWRHPVKIGNDLFTVIAAAQELALETGGAFDITFAPVIRLWRSARAGKQLPAPEPLARARQLSGYRNLTLDPARRTLALRMPGMQLDLGGIAKGYAADEALAVLRARGISQALVAASGDLAIGDAPPGKPGWRVGIDPLETPAFARVLILKNAAVSTSGDAEQFALIGGVRYSHIVDPATGMALANRVAATVVAGKGIEADGFATAVCVLGLKRGMEFIEKRAGVAALIAEGGVLAESKRFRLLPKE